MVRKKKEIKKREKEITERERERIDLDLEGKTERKVSQWLVTVCSINNNSTGRINSTVSFSHFLSLISLSLPLSEERKKKEG